MFIATEVSIKNKIFYDFLCLIFVVVLIVNFFCTPILLLLFCLHNLLKSWVFKSLNFLFCYLYHHPPPLITTGYKTNDEPFLNRSITDNNMLKPTSLKIISNYTLGNYFKVHQVFKKYMCLKNTSCVHEKTKQQKKNTNKHILIHQENVINKRM